MTSDIPDAIRLISACASSDWTVARQPPEGDIGTLCGNARSWLDTHAGWVQTGPVHTHATGDTRRTTEGESQ